MNQLAKMTYEDFGKLKFLDYFPRSEKYLGISDAGIESGIGLASTDGYLSTVFTSPMGGEWKTAGIDLYFCDDCPVEPGNALLEALGLSISKGMTPDQVRERLGAPLDDHPTFLLFSVGQDWPYYVSCHFENHIGLSHVWIGRKDLADEVE